jgi:hypothetical protein
MAPLLPGIREESRVSLGDRTPLLRSIPMLLTKPAAQE